MAHAEVGGWGSRTLDQLEACESENWGQRWPELEGGGGATSHTAGDGQRNTHTWASASSSKCDPDADAPFTDLSSLELPASGLKLTLPAAFRGNTVPKVTPRDYQAGKGAGKQHPPAPQEFQRPAQMQPTADQRGAEGYDMRRLAMMAMMAQQNSSMYMAHHTESDNRTHHGWQDTVWHDTSKEESDPFEDENRFWGFIRDFNESGGFGFIECAKARQKYGCDVWIHRRQFFGFKVGDEVNFMVSKNHNGQPQARHVIKASDVARIKAKKKAQEERSMHQLRQKRNYVESGSAGVMSEEEAKRFQASLKMARR